MRMLNTKEFIEKSKQIHGNRFEYLEEYDSATDKIKIRCNDCDREFYQKAANHLQGAGCPLCMRSKGEKRIEDTLNKYKVEYVQQYYFKKCRGKRRPLPFDFFLPERNLCIEYQGEQHFKPVRFMGTSYENAVYVYNQTKEHDKTKEVFCKRNNIGLMKISYKDFNKIEDIIKEEKK